MKIAKLCLLVTILMIAPAPGREANSQGSEAVVLDESFGGAEFDSRLRWMNPPPRAEVRDGWLEVTVGDKTDFWQKTLTGESSDTGHFLYLKLSGDFVAEAKMAGDFLNQYDQAGLMLRQDESHWLNADAENDPVGTPSLGVVITRGTSDWSISHPAPKEFVLRLVRRGDLVEAYATLDGSEWSLLRQASFPLQDPVKVGLFAASPIKAGLRARFDYLKITRPPEAPKAS